MKRTSVKSAAAPLALGILVLLAVSALAATRPSWASGAQAAALQSAAVTDSAFLTINPLASFPLDPFLVSVQGGGPAVASTLAKDCTGYIPANPTVTVDFKGEVDLLRAFFYSDGDATLVIRTPDGAYLCGDDTDRLVLDPTIQLTEPALGRYDIWVGSKVATDLIPGFLVFTTRSEVDASRLVLGSLVKRLAAPAFIPVRDRLVNAAARLEQAEAAVETADALEAGSIAVTKEFTATGELPAVELQTGDTMCGGLVDVTPDYAFDWSGQADALSLFVEANGDTTLLVRTPDGGFLCADDADGTDNLNPLLVIPEPTAGRYLVWIGRVDPSAPVTGTLTLTEATDAAPRPFNQQ